VKQAVQRVSGLVIWRRVYKEKIGPCKGVSTERRSRSPRDAWRASGHPRLYAQENLQARRCDRVAWPLQEDYSDQIFEGLDHKSIVVTGRHFEACTFLKCNFGGSAFKNCRFIDCIFQNCDLSNLLLHGATFRDVSFKDCKLVGINWANASVITHLNFDGCVLNYASFVGLDLRKSTVKNCSAKEADFADANLGESDCRGTDFAAARFANTNLGKADFRKAINYSIRPDSNKLKKAIFSLPEATLLLYGLDIVLEE